MTPGECKEIAERLIASIKAGDLNEIQRLLDIADDIFDEQPPKPEAVPYVEHTSQSPNGA